MLVIVVTEKIFSKNPELSSGGSKSVKNSSFLQCDPSEAL
jgi:hypothetical protein